MKGENGWPSIVSDVEAMQEWTVEMGSDTEGGSALRADGGCFESAILAKPTVALIGVIEPRGND